MRTAAVVWREKTWARPLCRPACRTVAAIWRVMSTSWMGLFLERRGYPVGYLGANLPADEFARVVQRGRPRLVLVSAQTEETAEALAAVLRRLGRLPPPRPDLAYGGWVFNQRPELRARTAGVYPGLMRMRRLRLSSSCLAPAVERRRSDAFRGNDAHTVQIMYKTGEALPFHLSPRSLLHPMRASIIALPPRLLTRLLLAFTLLASLPLPASLGHAQTMSGGDIVDTVVAAGNFTTLTTALKAAGLVDTLEGPGPFTVFAPTDAAFAQLPAGTLESLLANPDQLRAVLTYHVVAGQVTAADVVKLHSATTLEGEDVTINAADGMVRIDDATVTTADIMASNGVIHVVDSVLLPPSMRSQPTMPTADIVDTAVAAGDFTTLATALKAAGLTDTLKGPGPFTVFAPTDAAFAKLPVGTLDSLLAHPDQLRAVLTYHVVAGADSAADVSQLQQAATVQGEDVLIQAADGIVQINDATVTQADIMASNGIIHVIDTVLLPPSLAANVGAQYLH